MKTALVCYCANLHIRIAKKNMVMTIHSAAVLSNIQCRSLHHFKLKYNLQVEIQKGDESDRATGFSFHLPSVLR